MLSHTFYFKEICITVTLFQATNFNIDRPRTIYFIFFSVHITKNVHSIKFCNEASQ